MYVNVPTLAPPEKELAFVQLQKWKSILRHYFKFIGRD